MAYLHCKPLKPQPPSAPGSEPPVVYQGVYGPWSVEQEDLIEVWTYRVSLTLVASGKAGLGVTTRGVGVYWSRVCAGGSAAGVRGGVGGSAVLGLEEVTCQV